MQSTEEVKVGDLYFSSNMYSWEKLKGKYEFDSHRGYHLF